MNLTKNIQLFTVACFEGKLETAKSIYGTCDVPMSQMISIIKTVCDLGHIDILKWIYELSFDIPADDIMSCFSSAYRNEMYDVAEWIARFDKIRNEYTIRDICDVMCIKVEECLRNFRTTDSYLQTKILTNIIYLQSLRDLHTAMYKLIDIDHGAAICIILSGLSPHLDLLVTLLKYACDHNKQCSIIELVNSLLRDYNCNNCILNRIMCKTDCVQLLISRPELNTKHNRNEILKKIFDINCVKLINHLVETGAYLLFNGQYAFRSACLHGYIDTAKLLVDKGADPRGRCDAGFKRACAGGHIDIAKWLVQLGADIHEGYEYGFRIACKKGHFNIAKWLVELGANIHKVQEYAFRMACKKGYFDIAKWLVELGANIHEGDEYALRIACERGYVKIVEWLIHLGVDVNILNDRLFKNIVTSYWYPEMFKFMYNLYEDTIIMHIHNISNINVIKITSDEKNAKLLHDVFSKETDSQSLEKNISCFKSIDNICIDSFAYHDKIDCLEIIKKYFPHVTYDIVDNRIVNYFRPKSSTKNARKC